MGPIKRVEGRRLPGTGKCACLAAAIPTFDVPPHANSALGPLVGAAQALTLTQQTGPR